MLNKIANLHKSCFPNKPWAASEFMDLKKSGCEVVASDQGFIVWRCAADECEVITIGVAPESRGQGIATAMLGIMEKQLVGIKKIFLEVASDNAAGRKLYENNGYSEIGIRPGYYDGIDAIIMQKEL